MRKGGDKNPIQVSSYEKTGLIELLFSEAGRKADFREGDINNLILGRYNIKFLVPLRHPSGLWRIGGCMDESGTQKRGLGWRNKYGCLYHIKYLISWD